jgi:hypothetical protein
VDHSHDFLLPRLFFVANHGTNITGTCNKLKSSSESAGIFVRGGVTCQLSPNFHVQFVEKSLNAQVSTTEPRKPPKVVLSISCIFVCILSNA